MTDLVFYTNPMSRGRIIRWMLEEVGQPYEAKVLAWEAGANRAPDYLAVNPMGKVPAIVHKGEVVTECAAICAYLADAFPQANLAPPPGSPDRGEPGWKERRGPLSPSHRHADSVLRQNSRDFH